MKNLLLVIITFLIGFNMNAQSNDLLSDEDAIKQVIQSAYVEGLQNEGDVNKIDNGFHPAFELLGIGKGDQIWKLPIYTWRERALDDLSDGKKPRSGNELVSVNFLSVDVTGTAAVVKLAFFVGNEKKYIDYLSLYKFKSGWKIVNKIFYKIPEEKSD